MRRYERGRNLRSPFLLGPEGKGHGNKGVDAVSGQAFVVDGSPEPKVSCAKRTGKNASI